MLAQRKVDALRNEWNEKAALMFIDAAADPDPEAQARLRGSAEMLAICASELKKASAEE